MVFPDMSLEDHWIEIGYLVRIEISNWIIIIFKYSYLEEVDLLLIVYLKKNGKL